MLAMENLDSFLTNLTTQAEQARTAAEKPILDGANKPIVKAQLGDVPLNKLTIPSLLTRAKLSPETRAMEERRLANIENVRKLEEARAKRLREQKRSRGVRHWKKKAATKRRADRKKYEESAGFRAIVGQPYGCKRIDPELWDKYIGECFREYTPKYLQVKKIKRAPGFGPRAYYGNKEFPMTVYSFRVVHDTLGVVWDGEEQRKHDGVEILRIPQAKEKAS